MAHDLEKKWRSDDVILLEEADFSSMMLSDRVLAGLTKAGFKKPSPIQYQAIPAGRFGKDLLVQAKSGTGKTLVFVVVALEMLKRKFHHPQVLILVPTREIATQICSVVRSVGSFIPKLKCESFIGGFAVDEDIKKAHCCQIVVGTLGRIKQLIEIKALNTKSIRLVVFDEADDMLAVSRLDEIDSIFTFLPNEKQIIATSATFPPKLRKVVIKYLRDPYLAQFDSRKLALLGIVHYVRMVESSVMPLRQYHFKLAALGPILKSIKFSQCLVFCNGIHKVETLYRDIKKWGFSATYISSNRDQKERLQAIECLKRFKCKVLVSSDVTSRGIDAEYVDLVVNFDVSNSTETYLHRSGRAGRYGTTGVTISIVDSFELKRLKNIEKDAHFKCYKLPDPVPVDLIKNPVLDTYAIEDTLEDSEEEEAKNEKDGESSKKLNGSVSRKKSAAKEANKKQKESPSKGIQSCISNANADEGNLKKDNGILEAVSDEDSICIINENSDENNQSDEIENEEHSFNNNGLSKSENVLEDNQVKTHQHNDHCSMHPYVDSKICSCDNIADNESSEIKSESNAQNVFSAAEVVLDSNVRNKYHSPEISKNKSDCENLNVVAPSECEILNGDKTSDCEFQNLSLSNECKTAEDTNTIANENSYESMDKKFNDKCETSLSVTEDQNIKDNFQDSSLIIEEDNQAEFHNLNKQTMTQAVENFIEKFESIKLSVSKSTDSESLPSENSDRKSILSTQIEDLNLKQSEYYYKIFKLYQEDNAYNHNEGEIKENLNTDEITCDAEAAYVKENISSGIKSKETSVSSQGILDDAPFVKPSHLAKKLKPDTSEKFNFPIPENEFVLIDSNIPNFHEIPLHESTPHCDKSNINIATLDMNAPGQRKQNTKNLFEEISEESDSDEELDVENYLASLALPSKKSDSDSSRSSHPRYSSSSSEDDESDEYAENYYRKESSGKVLSSSSENHSSYSDSYSSSSSSHRRHSLTYNGKRKLKDGKECMYPVHHPSTNFKKNRLHQTTFTKAFKVPPYADQVKPHYFQHNCLHHGHNNSQFANSSIVNFCQQPNLSMQSKASQYVHHSICSEHRQNDSKRKNKNMDTVKNTKCHSLNYGQPSSACCKTSHHNCHPYGSIANCNHIEICTQKPNHSRQANACQCIHHSMRSECKQHDTKSKQRNVDRVKKSHPLNYGQHSPAYYKPSDHVCHPYDSNINCNHREICDQWYQMFLNQWLYIQKWSQQPLGSWNFC